MGVEHKIKRKQEETENRQIFFGWGSPNLICLQSASRVSNREDGTKVFEAFLWATLLPLIGCPNEIQFLFTQKITNAFYKKNT